MERQMETDMKIDRIVTLDSQNHGHIGVMLAAFQHVFPSTVGPSIEDMVDPHQAVVALGPDSDGSVECRYAYKDGIASSVVWVDLISASRSRRFRAHIVLNRDAQIREVTQVEMLLDSRNAAEDVLRYLWANGDPEVLVRYRTTEATVATEAGALVGETLRASEALARLSPQAEVGALGEPLPDAMTGDIGNRYNVKACEAFDRISGLIARLNVDLREDGHGDIADALRAKVEEMKAIAAPDVGGSFWGTQYWRKTLDRRDDAHLQ